MAADPRAELVGLYRAVSLQVEQLARDYKARGALGSAAVTTRQLQHLQQSVARLDTGVASWMQRNIQGLYMGTIPEAVLSLQGAGIAVGVAGFTGHDRRALRALEERVSADLGSIRTAIGVGLVTGDRRQAREHIRRALEGEDQLVRLEDGRLSVKVPSGKYWRPDVYAEMLGRTAMADTRRVAFRERYLQNGVDVVRIVPNGTTHHACRVWEGESLSLTGATKGIPTISQARAAGLFHPNCAHRYVVDTSAKQPPVLPRRAPVKSGPRPLRTLGKIARTARRPRAPRKSRAPAPSASLSAAALAKQQGVQHMGGSTAFLASTATELQRTRAIPHLAARMPKLEVVATGRLPTDAKRSGFATDTELRVSKYANGMYYHSPSSPDKGRLWVAENNPLKVNGQLKAVKRPDSVLSHELGHAVDFGKAGDKSLSDSARFKQAWVDDVKDIYNLPPEQLKVYGTKAGQALGNRDEAFAEAFASVRTGSSGLLDSATFDRGFSRSVDVVRQYVETGEVPE